MASMKAMVATWDLLQKLPPDLALTPDQLNAIAGLFEQVRNSALIEARGAVDEVRNRVEAWVANGSWERVGAEKDAHTIISTLRSLGDAVLRGQS